jgi:hypothetical protein
VVEAGAAVQQQYGRSLDHRGAIGHQAGAIDVDEQPDPRLDLHPHQGTH